MWLRRRRLRSLVDEMLAQLEENIDRHRNAPNGRGRSNNLSRCTRASRPLERGVKIPSCKTCVSSTLDHIIRSFALPEPDVSAHTLVNLHFLAERDVSTHTLVTLFVHSPFCANTFRTLFVHFLYTFVNVKVCTSQGVYRVKCTKSVFVWV